jgi:carbamoyl-phosphate synthase large subunit
MNILLTCAGRRNYIVDYFREALQKVSGSVFSVNSSEYSTALSVSDKGFILPSLYDPTYIEKLLKICIEHKIKAIIPLFDLELPILAKARERFSYHNIDLVLSSKYVVDICNDKWRTFNYLQEIGVSVPKTYNKLNEVKEAIDKNLIDFPIIIKPRWGMGSIGLIVVENDLELQILAKRTLRIIQSSYLSSISQDAINEAILFQEKLQGQEYGLDVINDLEGKYIISIIKKKILMRSGETDVAMTVDDMILKQLGQRIGTKLGHIANLDIDVFLTPDGPLVLEMNPRFGGGYPFSHLAGINLPSAIISWLEGKEPDNSCFKVEYGVIGMKGLQVYPLKENCLIHIT